MSTTPSGERDERTVAVENASYRWAYTLLNFALLIDVAYRGMVRHEVAWDLIALIFVGFVFCTVYQARQKILSRRWVKEGLLIACLGAVIGAIMILIMRWSGWEFWR